MNLLEAQRAILGETAPLTIFDVGAHDGASTVEYLEGFPNATIFAFEPDETNHAAAENALSYFGSRAQLSRLALSDIMGESIFHVNSHSGTHSLLPIGEQRFWDAYAYTVGTQHVQTDTIDHFAAKHAISHIDILKMDIQGGELAALRGANRLLAAKAIDLIALEVEFQELYLKQPLFWDIGSYLHAHRYGFYGLFDLHYSSRNPNVFTWADAIFLAPQFLKVPEWAKV